MLGAGGLLVGIGPDDRAAAPPGARRAPGAARPCCLTALAVIPSIIMQPRFPYAQGLLLFALVAALLWGERVASRRSGPAFALIAATGIFAALLAPALHARSWLNYQTLTNGLAPSQPRELQLGPGLWPLHLAAPQREVLTVKAAHADYWKAADLDVFNGFGWAQGAGPVSSALPGRALGAQTLDPVADRDGQRHEDDRRDRRRVAAQRPAHLGAVDQTQSLGTWVASAPLHSGQTYTVKTYSPRPTAAELAAIPAGAYPDAPLADYRVVGLPASALAHYNLPEIEFPTFHSGGPALNLSGPYGTNGVALVMHSPYARAYALAHRLAAGAATPYAFVAAVLRYLSTANGFRYDERVASVRFPLETFLFSTHRGYCQHFAGAMALLLRMGGLPARVATGFTAGTFNSATGSFAVSDRDAHAWVEVWFPRYGWVRFDPTPAAAPAFADSANSGVLLGAPSLKPGAVTARRQGNLGRLGPAAARSGRGGHGLWVAIPLGLALIIGAGLALRLWRRPASVERLISELELALRRCGRPARDGLTLHALEQRFRASTPAVSYLRRLRLARYGRVSELPTGAQRRALRTQLAAGLGFGGWLRSWWALPPRRLRAPDS